MKEKDYIKGLEDQIEELQQKLGSLQNNIKFVATVKMTDAFKPEKRISLFAYIRVVKGDKMSGQQVTAVNIAVATQKSKHWQVNYHNEVLTFQIKDKIDDPHAIVKRLLKDAGYEHAAYDLLM